MNYVRVFQHGNTLLVAHVRNFLEIRGIPCELRNMTLGGGAGELPPNECEAQVWVAGHNRDRAEALIHEALHGPRETASAWWCPTCGERLDGVFDTCWQCAAPRPG